MLALLIEDSDIRATFLTTGGVATLARLDSYVEPMQLQAIGMLSKLIRSEDGKGDVEVMRQARAAGVFSAIPALLRASNSAVVNAALEVLTIGTTTLLDRGEARASDAATVVDQVRVHTDSCLLDLFVCFVLFCALTLVLFFVADHRPSFAISSNSDSTGSLRRSRSLGAVAM